MVRIVALGVSIGLVIALQPAAAQAQLTCSEFCPELRVTVRVVSLGPTPPFGSNITQVSLGQTFRYEIEVRNTAVVPSTDVGAATGVKLVGTLSGANFFAVGGPPATCDFEGQTPQGPTGFTCRLGTINAGGSVKIRADALTAISPPLPLITLKLKVTDDQGESLEPDAPQLTFVGPTAGSVFGDLVSLDRRLTTLIDGWASGEKPAFAMDQYRVPFPARVFGTIFGMSESFTDEFLDRLNRADEAIGRAHPDSRYPGSGEPDRVVRELGSVRTSLLNAKDILGASSEAPSSVTSQIDGIVPDIDKLIDQLTENFGPGNQPPDRETVDEALDAIEEKKDAFLGGLPFPPIGSRRGGDIIAEIMRYNALLALAADDANRLAPGTWSFAVAEELKQARKQKHRLYELGVTAHNAVTIGSATKAAGCQPDTDNVVVAPSLFAPPVTMRFTATSDVGARVSLEAINAPSFATFAQDADDPATGTLTFQPSIFDWLSSVFRPAPPFMSLFADGGTADAECDFQIRITVI